jgi:hypothetical protein
MNNLPPSAHSLEVIYIKPNDKSPTGFEAHIRFHTLYGDNIIIVPYSGDKTPFQIPNN